MPSLIEQAITAFDAYLSKSAPSMNKYENAAALNFFRSSLTRIEAEAYTKGRHEAVKQFNKHITQAEIRGAYAKQAEIVGEIERKLKVIGDTRCVQHPCNPSCHRSGEEKSLTDILTQIKSQPQKAE